MRARDTSYELRHGNLTVGMVTGKVYSVPVLAVQYTVLVWVPVSGILGNRSR